MPRINDEHGVVLLVYHSITEYREDRIRVPNIVTPVAFEAQIRYLVSTHSVIALPEYLSHMKEGKPFRGRTAVVTMDDGYKDNLVIAAPILRKYGVPATFFVVTGCIGSDTMKWEDELSCLIRRSKTEAWSLTLPSGEVSLHAGNDKARLRTIDALVDLLGHLKQTERLQVLDQLREQAKAKCDDWSDVMMTWDDVRHLADTPGFSVGSHTVTHQHLSRLPLDDVIFEVTSSREQLQNEIGRPVTLLAYPYGDFDRAVITAVQSAGYSSAATLEYGQNSIRSDPFRLKRVLAPNQSGARFSAGMRLRASPFGELLRRSYSAVSSLSRRAIIKRTSTKTGTVAVCGS